MNHITEVISSARTYIDDAITFYTDPASHAFMFHDFLDRLRQRNLKSSLAHDRVGSTSIHFSRRIPYHSD